MTELRKKCWVTFLTYTQENIKCQSLYPNPDLPGSKGNFTITWNSTSPVNVLPQFLKYLQPLFSYLLTIVKNLLNILLKLYLFTQLLQPIKDVHKLFWTWVGSVWPIGHTQAMQYHTSGTTSYLLEPLFGSHRLTQNNCKYPKDHHAGWVASRDTIQKFQLSSGFLMLLSGLQTCDWHCFTDQPMEVLNSTKWHQFKPDGVEKPPS